MKIVLCLVPVLQHSPSPTISFKKVATSMDVFFSLLSHTAKIFFYQNAPPRQLHALSASQFQYEA
jgi:hypothetical protein